MSFPNHLLDFVNNDLFHTWIAGFAQLVILKRSWQHDCLHEHHVCIYLNVQQQPQSCVCIDSEVHVTLKNCFILLITRKKNQNFKFPTNTCPSPNEKELRPGSGKMRGLGEVPGVLHFPSAMLTLAMTRYDWRQQQSPL